ncbi:hypothetical protein VNO77_14563 [Canavalia gladiata]|uniref:Uncharacterized protein n=1 Tax=Canavalia gladiata TaxID=3824 RepID=A0AAN9QR11_CANGL
MLGLNWDALHLKGPLLHGWAKFMEISIYIIPTYPENIEMVMTDLCSVNGDWTASVRQDQFCWRFLQNRRKLSTKRRMSCLHLQSLPLSNDFAERTPSRSSPLVPFANSVEMLLTPEFREVWGYL